MRSTTHPYRPRIYPGTTAALCAYDYGLTFIEEVEYIWRRKFTIVSFLFILIQQIWRRLLSRALLGWTYCLAPGVITSLYRSGKYAYTLHYTVPIDSSFYSLIC